MTARVEATSAELGRTAATTTVVRDAIAVLVESAEPSELVQAAAAVTAAGTNGELDPSLWGPAPSSSDVAGALVANLRKRFEARRAVEARSVTRKVAAELLDCSEQAVTNHLEAGRLIGLKTRRSWVIPAWQFDPDAPKGFLPALDQLRAAFPGGPVALSAWAQAPHPDLVGRSPAQALLRGDVDAVLAAAERTTAAAW